MTNAITLVEPTRILQRSNLPSSKPAEIDKATSLKLDDVSVKSKSWEDLRRQLLGNNIFIENRNFGEHLFQRSKRSIKKLKPTNSRQVLLSCKLQNYNLAIMSDGKVKGLKNQTSPFGMYIYYIIQFFLSSEAISLLYTQNTITNNHYEN